jgi:hypothetical protein
LTARTVLEDGEEGKGGGVAGVSPAGFGAEPHFNRIRLPLKLEDSLKNRGQLQIPAHSRFFINGVFIGGAQPVDEFEKLIDNELKLAKQRTAVQTSR